MPSFMKRQGQKKLEEEARKAEVAREAEEREKSMMKFQKLPEGMNREQIQKMMREGGGRQMDVRKVEEKNIVGIFIIY
ncbi:hypothetical protein ES705_10395 [subsurface metagenome]